MKKNGKEETQKSQILILLGLIPRRKEPRDNPSTSSVIVIHRPVTKEKKKNSNIHAVFQSGFNEKHKQNVKNDFSGSKGLPRPWSQNA